MSTTQAGGSTTDQAKETAQQAAEQARGAAREGAQRARDRARDEVDRRSTQVGEQASTTAEAIRQASSHLRDEGHDGPARVVEQAAGRLERAGGWLKESDGDRILEDAEDFARRKPWAVMGAGLAAGFVLSRMLKTSSRERYRRTQPARSELPEQATPAVPATGAETIVSQPPRTVPGTPTPGPGMG